MTIPTHRSARPERGSAYIAALLALVILSAIGLSVTLVTQTEMQIGATERTVQRVFYAADAGIGTSTARALANADYGSRTYSMEDLNTPEDLNLRHEVEASPFYPILDSPCNLCEINDAGSYSDKAYRRINHAVTIIARRVGGATDTRLSEKMLTSICWRPPCRMRSPCARPDPLPPGRPRLYIGIG